MCCSLSPYKVIAIGNSDSLTIKGRALRSGRTLPGDYPGSSESPEVVETSEEESGMEVGGAWDVELESDDSTASSDISDWTAEAGINFRAPVRKQPRRRRRRR
jgi:hypothetical protein